MGKHLPVLPKYITDRSIRGFGSFCDQNDILLTCFQHNIKLEIGEKNKALAVFYPAILGEQMIDSGHLFVWHLWIIVMDY